MSIAHQMWVMEHYRRDAVGTLLLLALVDGSGEWSEEEPGFVARLAEWARVSEHEAARRYVEMWFGGWFEPRPDGRVGLSGVPPTARRPVRPGNRGAGVSPALRRYVFERDGYRCRACGSESDLTLDHMVPQSRGGESTDENLQTLCRGCNSRKGAKV